MSRMFLSLVAVVALLAPQVQAQTQPPTKTPGAKPAVDRPAAKPAVQVNLNTATAADLQQLPGVGAKVAARIIEYRQARGPFKKIEELMNVQGIGEKTFLRLRPQLTVGGKSESPATPQN